MFDGSLEADVLVTWSHGHSDTLRLSAISGQSQEEASAALVLSSTLCLLPLPASGGSSERRCFCNFA